MFTFSNFLVFSFQKLEFTHELYMYLKAYYDTFCEVSNKLTHLLYFSVVQSTSDTPRYCD